MTRKYIIDFTHILKDLSMLIEGNLICEETIDCGFKQNGPNVKNKDFLLVKVLWKDQSYEEDT